jgi:hypothetical protein
MNLNKVIEHILYYHNQFSRRKSETHSERNLKKKQKNLKYRKGMPNQTKKN